MYRQKDRFRVFALTLTSALLFIGCGSGSSTSQNAPAQTTEKSSLISTYITKGNFVEVAGFAYKKATDPNFKQYAMDVKLPGTHETEAAKPSTYNVTVINSDNRLKKIVVENYQNSLELKVVDNDRVNILFKDSNFTVDKQMSFNDFTAQ